MAAGHVSIIADWEDDTVTSIRIQDFKKDGGSFIPIFTSKDMFDRHMQHYALR